MVKDIGAALNSASFVFFVTYKGLKVKDFSRLRDALSKEGAKCRVFSNRLVRKAAELNGHEALAKLKITGDSAMITGSGDVSAVAKLLEEFRKTNESMAPKCGYMEKAVIGKSDFKMLATLPPREILLSQLLGLLQTPARNLVNVLHAKVSSVVNVINAYKNKVEAAGSPETKQ
jgi:large subunit ribosomal protein L10